jgi:hypothetical protein
MTGANLYWPALVGDIAVTKVGELAPVIRMILVIVGTLAVVTGPASAQSGPFYIRGDVGVALGTPSNEYDTVPSADNASLGSDVIWGKPDAGVNPLA